MRGLLWCDDKVTRWHGGKVTGSVSVTLSPCHLVTLSMLFAHHVVADRRRRRVGVRAEVAQRDERLLAGILEHHAGAGGVVADEHLVFGQLAEADHRRRLQR